MRLWWTEIKSVEYLLNLKSFQTCMTDWLSQNSKEDIEEQQLNNIDFNCEDERFPLGFSEIKSYRFGMTLGWDDILNMFRLVLRI